MLFNSFSFMFVFFPIVLIGYFILGRFGNFPRVLWQALSSLTFYGIENWRLLPLLVGSIAFNYAIGFLLIGKRYDSRSRFRILTIGVAGNLIALGIFKYAGFLTTNFNAVFDTGFVVSIVL